MGKGSKVVLAGGQQLLKFVEQDDVGWGVLADGTAIVSARGLAKLCGVAASTMIELAQDWVPNSKKKRDQIIQRYAEDLGYFENSLRIDVDGNPFFIDRVAIAILKYYAENASPPKDEARRALMAFAGFGFREYVYKQVGYERPLTDIEMLRDRALLNHAPPGYFSSWFSSFGTGGTGGVLRTTTRSSFRNNEPIAAAPKPPNIDTTDRSEDHAR